MLWQLKAPLVRDSRRARRRSATKASASSRQFAHADATRAAGGRSIKAACTSSRSSTSSTSKRWACSGSSSSTGCKRISPRRSPNADRRLRPRAALRALSPVGLDDRGRREGARDAPALHRGDGAQRPHPSGHRAQRRQHPFATAASTAYPQPAPGAADKPGPVTLPKDQLLHAIGYRSVELAAGAATLAQHALG